MRRGLARKKEGRKGSPTRTEEHRQADTVLRGSPGRRGEPPQEPAGAAQPLTCRSGSDPQSPLEGVWGWEEAVARAVCSGAGAFLWPLGGRGEARRSGCSSALPSRRGLERGLAAQPCAGAVQRRRCISRCTDRSAGGCADRCTFSTTRARATMRRPQRSASGEQRRAGSSVPLPGQTMAVTA